MFLIANVVMGVMCRIEGVEAMFGSRIVTLIDLVMMAEMDYDYDSHQD
jgi:hypothetical protein